MTTPTQRITRLLDEGAKFIVEIPGHVVIEVTPDVIAATAEVLGQLKPSDQRGNLLKAND